MTKQMRFPNYDELVIRNKDIYLDSIISRYGEENRELLSQRYDSTKMCFFTNPDRLTAYIEYNSRDALTLETKKFFEEIGLTNPTQEILKAFFGEYKIFNIYHYNSSSNNFGLFSFLESNNNKKSTEEQRELFLSKVSPNDLLLYKGNSKALIVEKYSKIAEYAYSKLRIEMTKYSDILDQIKYLTTEEDKLFDDRLKVYFASIVDLLCDQDRKLVLDWMNGGKKFEVSKLKDYSLFLFDVSKIKDKKSKKQLTFEPGLIEYFGSRISEEFLMSSPERRTEINVRRIKYLQLLGFDTNVIESKYNLSSFDISKLPEIKKYLPKESVVVKLQENREFAKKKIAKTFFEKNIINSVNLPYDWFYEEIMEGSSELGHSWVSTKTLPNGFDVYVFFGPHDNGYDIFDHDFDHEMTHSLETNCYYLDNGDFIRKFGIQLEVIKTSGQVITKNKNLNEAITEFLATQSTRNRYRKKQYMFEKPKDESVIEDSSIYSKNLEKAKVLIEILPPEFIKNRIGPSIDFIYEYFDQNTWDELDNMIDDDSISTEEFIDYIESKRRKSL